MKRGWATATRWRTTLVLDANTNRKDDGRFGRELGLPNLPCLPAKVSFRLSVLTLLLSLLAPHDAQVVHPPTLAVHHDDLHGVLVVLHGPQTSVRVGKRACLADCTTPEPVQQQQQPRGGTVTRPSRPGLHLSLHLLCTPHRATAAGAHTADTRQALADGAAKLALQAHPPACHSPGNRTSGTRAVRERRAKRRRRQ